MNTQSNKCSKKTVTPTYRGGTQITGSLRQARGGQGRNHSLKWTDDGDLATSTKSKYFLDSELLTNNAFQRSVRTGKLPQALHTPPKQRMDGPLSEM